MGIIQAICGCLAGVLIFKVLALVIPIASWGIWSTGILVALCLIGTYILGFAPQWWANRPKPAA